MADPKITKVEVHEFQWDLQDIGSDPTGRIATYVPGEKLTLAQQAVRIHSDVGALGEFSSWGTVARPEIAGCAEYLLGKNPLDRERIYADLGSENRRLREQLTHLGRKVAGLERKINRLQSEAELRQRLSDRMLVPDDPRLSRVATGYALQSLAWCLTGWPFCSAPTCPLYNARRQEELIRAQCSDESSLCADHRALFYALREGAGA